MIPCVLFEDEHLLVVNKPAGVNTHAPAPFAGEGLYDWLRQREPRWASLAIIHRLDKETSGVMVFGKTPLANRSLTEQFTAREARKKYFLLTDRPVKQGDFTVKSEIRRVGEHYASGPGGEPAETHFRVLGKWPPAQSGEPTPDPSKEGNAMNGFGGPNISAASKRPGRAPLLGGAGGGFPRSTLTLIEAEPRTGRTHQIRVHAAESGFPILGDTLYGGTPAQRVFLHAVDLSFKHPETGAVVEFSTAEPFGVPDLAAPMHSRKPLTPALSPSDGGREKASPSCNSSPFSEAIQSPPGDSLAPSDGERVRVRGASNRIVTASPQAHGDQLNPRLQALARHMAIIDLAETNAFRLIHGASDGWPGWYVERLGDFLLSQGELPLSAEQQNHLERLLADTNARGAYHKLLNRQVRRTAATDASPQLVAGAAAPERFEIRENDVRYELSFSEGYSVGLFLDQRDNRRRFITGHIAAGFPLVSAERGVRSAELLNCFAYTCGFSVCAALGGARTTSLDLSKKYLEWGRRNFALNGLDPAQHDFIYGDTFDWLRRLGKKGRAFDAIVLDPPTFSQSKESGVFRAEKDYGKLVTAALPVLKPGGVLLASTNAAEWPPEAFVETVKAAVISSDRRIGPEHFVPQPLDFPITRGEPSHLKTFWVRVD